MTDAEFKKFEEFTARELEKSRHITKEEAIAQLHRMGFVDKEGNHIEPFKYLDELFKPIEK